jgi:hypothetical protein
VIVRFVDIGEIVDHHCLNFLLFVDIGGIVDDNINMESTIVRSMDDNINMESTIAGSMDIRR